MEAAGRTVVFLARCLGRTVGRPRIDCAADWMGPAQGQQRTRQRAGGAVRGRGKCWREAGRVGAVQEGERSWAGGAVEVKFTYPFR